MANGDLDPLLFDALPQLLVRDPSQPSGSQDVSNSAADGSLKFVNDPLRQSPGLRSVQEDGLNDQIENFQWLCPQRDVPGSPDGVFLHPASTPSSVPPMVVSRLLRYVKAMQSPGLQASTTR